MKNYMLIMLLLTSLSMRSQTITTIAGGGIGWDGSPATAAQLFNPIAHKLDTHGNLYIAESGYAKARVISNTGIISTFAGTAGFGFSGDGGPATNAKISAADGIAIDTLGNIFFSDVSNHRIRKVEIETGIISTVVGNGTLGFGGDGGPAINAMLGYPSGICFDRSGNLFIDDEFNRRVRKVNNAGIISTVAGNGVAGSDGDGGQATNAKCMPKYGIATDKSGNLYLCDDNYSIRKVTTSGIISTVAGNNLYFSYNGDEIPATAANISPLAIAVDAAGALYITDWRNYRVRKVDPNGIIHTVAGTGTPGNTGDGGAATNATFFYPAGITLDSCNNLFVSDIVAHRIRKIELNPPCTPINVPTIRNQIAHITLVPNPAFNTVTIASTEKIRSIAVIDLLGRALFTGSYYAEKVEVDIQHVPAGVYLVRVNEVYVQKMVKE